MSAFAVACRMDYGEEHAARTREALAARKAAGVRLGRPVDVHWKVRGRIVSERRAGRTLWVIANGLTDDGVPTARGGKKWYASTVAAVLRSLDFDREADEARGENP